MNKIAQIKLMSKVLQTVSEHLNVNVFDVLGPSRHQHLVDARHMAMLLMQQRGMSLKSIGRFMNRDHTSVLYSIRAIRNLIEIYPPYKDEYDQLTKILCV